MKQQEPTQCGREDRVRLDKWLWAARFYRTRNLSSEAIDKGRVTVNGLAAKPGREVRVGDLIELRSGPVQRTVTVRAVSTVRGPASAAAQLYLETPESVDARQKAAELRRMAPEPALTLTGGRPSKRDRRAMDRWQEGAAETDRGGWNQRWSASLDD